MKRVVSIKRRIYWTKEFDSSHFLELEYESKCRRLHGHTYRVEVEIEGEPNEHGMIFDFNHLSELIKTLDHKVIVSEKWVRYEEGYVLIEKNDKLLKLPRSEVVVIDKPNVTAEYIAEWISERILENAGENVREIRVRVWEDPRSYAEITLTLKPQGS
ncbi:6-pyruvoyl trahydropterin synthase family protein [Pyrococcus abyssi]|uniref:Putative 6-carboxy-5,6,7,8-tetrahydropterin synthase n=1 Tax=Pyrococcus abyssi (strain GE5 / Orsay) TaxID=272844 RepID=QUED_PYRAB|nr:6-pyruvoyl tetrahydropterin synthase family protein [Pyrococcus abyssi]Q9UXZ4.1 RecName: Full=Putative 6-carboxy-5,6,7,8-tetrahydropterin synthase; Short=CPH4 synthase; AltName: Full=Archaeosine biosynthesis protein QueD [Pyrococcus abyssi GE5]CAB50618.1 6-pyruvoyl tetrahydrobiopterin synthase related protein [Pyrococcus abyssi GE5]CCE71185.1 TPA: 6-pyruvoyl tetrahydrobiopterin synthase related protein [Pyrococcus abyssi GE5]